MRVALEKEKEGVEGKLVDRAAIESRASEKKGRMLRSMESRKAFSWTRLARECDGWMASAMVVTVRKMKVDSCTVLVLVRC